MKMFEKKEITEHFQLNMMRTSNATCCHSCSLFFHFIFGFDWTKIMIRGTRAHNSIYLWAEYTPKKKNFHLKCVVMMTPVPISVCPLRGTGYHVSSSLQCVWHVVLWLALCLRCICGVRWTCARVYICVRAESRHSHQHHHSINVTCLMQQIWRFIFIRYNADEWFVYYIDEAWAWGRAVDSICACDARCGYLFVVFIKGDKTWCYILDAACFMAK